VDGRKPHRDRCEHAVHTRTNEAVRATSSSYFDSSSAPISTCYPDKEQVTTIEMSEGSVWRSRQCQSSPATAPPHRSRSCKGLLAAAQILRAQRRGNAKRIKLL
jgi:hypothetical protein